MLRDSVCDEATNTEICLFDGGDCCLELKDTTLCNNCSCNLLVDPKELIEQFSELDIKPLRDPKVVDTAIEQWTIQVEDVVSGPVCAVLCLGNEIQNHVNTWQYLPSMHICKCGWIVSDICPEHIAILNWNMNDTSDLTHNTYLQVGKTIPCGNV